MEVTEIAVDVSPTPGRSSRPELRWDPGGATGFAEGTLRVGPAGSLEVHSELVDLGSGIRISMTIRNPGGPGTSPVALDRLRLRLDAAPTRVMEHGWQSWSPVGPRRLRETHPRRLVAPAWVRSTYHAEGRLAGHAVCGDQFMLMTSASGGSVAGFLDGRRNLSTVLATPAGVVAIALLDGVVLGPGEERALDPMWIATGDPGKLYSELVDHWGSQSGARTAAPSPLGWCSWYHYFMKIRPDDVRRDLGYAHGHGFDLVQIDDGYAADVGDWFDPRPAFAPSQMEDLAAEITAKGIRAGIWTAPFLAGAHSRLARAHPEWLVADDHRRPVTAIWNPVTWRGTSHALDTTNPAVLDHLRETFSRLVGEGWTYHKIDFCYAAAMPGIRHASGKVTRAEALRSGLEAVREGAGDDAFILGCGCPLAQAVGVVDAMRVSADTAPKWSPGVMQVPGYPEPSPAARNAMVGTLLRAPMHRRLWVNDPDCLMLRNARTRLGADRRAAAKAVIAGTGGFTVVSDDLSLYGPEEWDQLSELREALGQTDHPLDIADPFAEVLEVSSPSSHLAARWAGSAPAPQAEDGSILVSGGDPARGPWARLSLRQPSSRA